MKVLVADDNELMRDLIQATLESAGYQVETVANGLDALEVIRKGGARLVISDWEMPGLNGPDLCRAVRAEDLPGYVFIILVTSHGSARSTVEGLSAGADDFVSKPFDPACLLARVRTGERIIAMETRDVAIFAMAKLAESRDPETGLHLERTRAYCRILARELATMPQFEAQISPEFIRLIYLTSPLHDIGKVGIPDGVLLKPGVLRDREFEIMKSHASIGAKTLDAALKAFPDVKFLQMARAIAATHHERWDGTGYPCGLAGTEIPLCGRIMAVADVYDALTSKRVYKDAFDHEIAKSMIVADAGSHFDPDVVSAFERVEDQFVEVLAQYAEAELARR